MNKVFLDIESKLNELLSIEEIQLSDHIKKKFLTLMSTLTVYEEEEIKIFPKLIVGNNILETINVFLTSSHIVKVSEENIEAKEFEKKMKSLLPFCNMGWHVFVDIDEGSQKICYGIVRSYTGISGIDIQDQIFFGITSPLKLIFIEPSDKTTVHINGVKDKLIIDFKLFNDESHPLSMQVIDNLCQDLVFGLDNNEDIFKVFKKFFIMAQKKVHGTILLIVDSTNIEPPNSISDGNWFKADNLVDLADSALNVLREEHTHADIEKHYSLTGLFVSMMNMDGITVINDKGQIIAYNVFLKQNFIEEQNISGGARKRTALSLIKLVDSGYKIKGVYFQSQDGNTNYERVENVE